MASDAGVGDSEVPRLDVAPADGSTSVTLTVTAPDGTVTTPTMTGGDLVVIANTSPVEYSQRWTATSPVVYSAPGRWVLHYEVTGTGQGVEDLEVYVVASPVAGGPTWTPGRSRVANYVPHRTLSRSLTSTTEGQDVYEFTFDSNTVPTGLAVQRLIADGMAWVSARISPMAAATEPAASVIVSLYAAAAVERGWPQDDNSLQRANDLEKRMDLLLKDLVAANNASNGTDDYGLETASAVWSFPPADPRWDYPTYW
jgi:hypothetical protein